MNKLLMEENDRLQKQVSQLVYENGYFRQQTQNVSFGLNFLKQRIPHDVFVLHILLVLIWFFQFDRLH